MSVVIRLKGGLGNQLFEYAAGLYFTKQYGGGIEIVRHEGEKTVCYGRPRPCLLDKFNITAPIRDENFWDRLMCSEAADKRMFVTPLRRMTRTEFYHEHFSKTWAFEPDIPVPSSTRNLYINGFFQVYQYPDAVAEQLRREFTLRSEPSAENSVTLDQIRECESSVSLHIRRGDYEQLYRGRDVLPLAYVKNAIKEIQDHVSNPTFFVFSDDIPYARENLSHVERIVFVENNDELNAAEDLRLMAACRHHIIANSTFSWWGAWLNPDPNKIVCAPDVWRDPKVPTPDLLPSSWKRVKSEAILNYAVLPR